MARKVRGTLAGKLEAGGVVGRGQKIPRTPKVSAERKQAAANTGGDPSMPFVQTRGPRANQSYAIKKGKKGNVRVYDSGEKIGVPKPSTPLGTAGARAPRPTVLRQQRESDIADTAAAANLYKRFLDKQRPVGATVSPSGRRRTRKRVSTGGTQAP